MSEPGLRVSPKGSGRPKTGQDEPVAVTTVDRSPSAHAGKLGALLLVGAFVAVALGVYAKVHDPAARPVFTLGFSGVLQMKSWLTTLALALVVVQLTTALWMWGRLPGARPMPAGVGWVHRWSGAVAFVVTLPVAFHCLWSLGFGSGSTRVLVHGIAGCAFYGAYAAKMLGLRIAGLPARTLPVLGGLVVATVVILWLTAALWFFSRSGLPVT
jgi:Family of unknown function (DUF6529)